MLDIRFIRENAEAVQANARNKGYDVSIDELLKWDKTKRQLQQQADELRARRHEIAADIKGGRPVPAQIAEGRVLKDELTAVDASLKEADLEFTKLIKLIPNMAAADVPVGKSEDDNLVTKTVGDVPVFEFTPKNHSDIASAKGWLDKERAAKVAGARFAYIKGDLVKLQFAIMQYVMDQLSSEAVLKNIIERAGVRLSAKPFELILPPAMIRTEVYDATARLNSEEVTYKLADDELWLNASAEHSLAPMYMNEIIPANQLPARYLGFSTAFRREAGTYGKDTEGIFRMHQFDKLELESFTTADSGLEEHLFFVAIQEYFLQRLQLPYRVVTKCTAEIGKPNARGIDMEAWLPGQSKYRETHTADYMSDYQARRLNTRYRRPDGTTELVHTNDATGFALGRILIAIMENYQTASGDVRVPDVLQPYLGGRSQI